MKFYVSIMHNQLTAAIFQLVLIGLLAVLGKLSIDYGWVGSSYTVSKQYKAELQIESFYTYANSEPYRTKIHNLSELNNNSFVAVTKLDAGVYKVNDNGDVLDPWGLPYIISRNNDQITIMSPGLEEHNKLPWYKRIFQ